MTTATAKYSAGCGGDGCDARDPWPLHHVRHRGVFCRLCTSCVLKYHPGHFCPICFAVLDTCDARDPVVHCSKCPTVSHLACLPDPDLASQFVCPNCQNPEGFSYYPDGRRRSIDLASAKVLLAAAKLAASSMNRAAAVARAEAERKVKEAAVARKRAREMLEKALTISKKEKEEMKESVKLVTKLEAAVEPKKKKAARVNSSVELAVVGQKKIQNREIEKWMRFHEPVQGIGQNQKFMDVSHVDMKSRVGRMTQLPNCSGQEEKEKKGPFLDSQSGSVKKEERRSMGDVDKGPRIPQPTQDALVSRTNPRTVFTGSPSTASLHS